MSESEPRHVQRHPGGAGAFARLAAPAGVGWGAEGLNTQHRHYQEIIDALGRSLSLVSAPDPAHDAWLEARPGISRIAIIRRSRRRITTGRRSREPARTRLPAPVDRRRNPGLALGAHGHRRRSRRAPHHARDRLGAQLPARLGSVHGCDVADRSGWRRWGGSGSSAGNGRCRSTRSRRGSRPISASCRSRTSGPTEWRRRRQRSVAARRDLLRDANGRDAAVATKCRRSSLLRPDAPQAVAAVIDRALSLIPPRDIPRWRRCSARSIASSAAGR